MAGRTYRRARAQRTVKRANPYRRLVRRNGKSLLPRLKRTQNMSVEDLQNQVATQVSFLEVEDLFPSGYSKSKIQTRNSWFDSLGDDEDRVKVLMAQLAGLIRTLDPSSSDAYLQVIDDEFKARKGDPETLKGNLMSTIAAIYDIPETKPAAPSAPSAAAPSAAPPTSAAKLESSGMSFVDLLYDEADEDDEEEAPPATSSTPSRMPAIPPTFGESEASSAQPQMSELEALRREAATYRITSDEVSALMDSDPEMTQEQALDILIGMAQESGDQPQAVSTASPSAPDYSKPTPPPRTTEQRRTYAEQRGQLPTKTYELSPLEEYRLALFSNRPNSIRETYGPFFLFLQFKRRTLPLPSLEDWLDALGPLEGNEIRGDLQWSNPDMRNKIYLYVRRKPEMPTQMFVPSLNPVRRGKKLEFAPVAEFISRDDIVPGLILPQKLVAPRFGYPKTDQQAQRIAERVGEFNNPDSVTSWWQMMKLVGINESRSPWRSRREKYQAYDVILFEETEGGKPRIVAYFDSPRQSLRKFSMPSKDKLPARAQLPNPRRRRRRITTKRRR